MAVSTTCITDGHPELGCSAPTNLIPTLGKLLILPVTSIGLVDNCKSGRICLFAVKGTHPLLTNTARDPSVKIKGVKTKYPTLPELI